MYLYILGGRTDQFEYIIFLTRVARFYTQLSLIVIHQCSHIFHTYIFMSIYCIIDNACELGRGGQKEENAGSFDPLILDFIFLYF